MMRTIIAALVIQFSGLGAGHMPTVAFEPIRTADATVFMQWNTSEKCYECSTRYLMACLNGNNDCNVPTKSVGHFGWFKNATEALKLANEEQLEVTGIYETREVKFEVVNGIKREPQPDKVTPTLEYKLKGRP